MCVQATRDAGNPIPRRVDRFRSTRASSAGARLRSTSLSGRVSGSQKRFPLSLETLQAFLALALARSRLPKPAAPSASGFGIPIRPHAGDGFGRAIPRRRISRRRARRRGLARLMRPLGPIPARGSRGPLDRGPNACPGCHRGTLTRWFHETSPASRRSRRGPIRPRDRARDPKSVAPPAPRVKRAALMS